ncbi:MULTISPECIES: TatD family hydrolase [Nocardia]|uniref:TatD family hydrolase n=1 Tax=Nocardia abscessus TaxID=120957 RepID=UPI002B4B4196|nr:TatD family hydrolase [Nocardia abscessus]
MTTEIPARWLLDTHCHLDAYHDPLAELERANQAGVHVVAVTEDPGRYRILRTRLGRRPGVEVAVGYHPMRVGNLGTGDLLRFLRLLPQANWVGEIGLDFSRHALATKTAQIHAFEAILAEPRLRTTPVTVHSRGAERDTITRLAQARIPAILHWYTGPLGPVEDALAAGMYFSINPAMLASRKSATLVSRLPVDRILLETDGPHTRLRSRETKPADIAAIVGALASLWQVSEQHAHATVCANQQQLLRGLNAAAADHHRDVLGQP